MPRSVSIDDIDDPVLLLGTARIEDHRFAVEGYVDLQGGLLLYEREQRRRNLSELLRRSPWERVPLRVEIDNVESFRIDDRELLGELIVDSIEYSIGSVVIEGVIPCQLSVESSEPKSLRIILTP